MKNVLLGLYGGRGRCGFVFVIAGSWKSRSQNAMAPSPPNNFQAQHCYSMWELMEVFLQSICFFRRQREEEGVISQICALYVGLGWTRWNVFMNIGGTIFLVVWSFECHVPTHYFLFFAWSAPTCAPTPARAWQARASQARKETWKPRRKLN